uniref:Uncharacterized protein n=1 Tax=Otarine gammaherpesvirus 4 TaxID=2801541 RepID=A0A889IYE7_9GAMA|nr:hypothetical protein [Otarine gammaherpesvirus 4]
MDISPYVQKMRGYERDTSQMLSLRQQKSIIKVGRVSFQSLRKEGRMALLNGGGTLN